MAKIVTVFGSTGVQGGSVCRALIKDSRFKVRAVTRVASGTNARELAALGVDIIVADFDNPNTLRAALEGSFSTFVVTSTDFNNPDSVAREIQQGKNIADACAASNVQHVIYSTQQHVLKILGILSRHLVAKAEIEDYMKEKCRSVTCIMVPICYESLLTTFCPERVEENEYRFAIPMGLSPMDMIAIEDVGKVVHAILCNPQHVTKTLSLSGDKITIPELTAMMCRELYPLKFTDRQVTIAQFRQLGFSGCNDWANMFDFFLRVDQKYNIASTKKLNPELQSFQSWLQRNKDQLINNLNTPDMQSNHRNGNIMQF